jgi:hypothetical protein
MKKPRRSGAKSVMWAAKKPGGNFDPHRDNATETVALHRRYAQSHIKQCYAHPGTTPAPSALSPRMQAPGCPHPSIERPTHSAPTSHLGAFFSTRNATRCNTRPAAATTQQQRRTDGTNWGVPRSSRTHSRSLIAEGLPKHTGPSRSAQTPVEGGAISAARWLSLQQQRARSLERSTRPHKRRHRRICIGRMTRPHACSTA